MGCSPAQTPEPAPTPIVLHASITPALNTLRPLFKSCIEEQPALSLIVSESPAADFPQNGLAFQWGANNLPGGFAAVLGEESLVLIAHPQNPRDTIALTDLQSIYSGTRLEWPDSSSEEVQPWAYPAGTDIQEIFTALTGGAPSPTRATYLAPDPAAMIEAVASSPGAIGFIPRRWLDDRVKVIRVLGLEENQLVQPILSISRSEPEGPEQSWLLCVQAGLAE